MMLRSICVRLLYPSSDATGHKVLYTFFGTTQEGRAAQIHCGWYDWIPVDCKVVQLYQLIKRISTSGIRHISFEIGIIDTLVKSRACGSC